MKTTDNGISPMRRSSRRRPSADYGTKIEREPTVTDDDKAETNEEETPLRRTRSKDRTQEKIQDEDNHSGWVRRSSRRTKSFSPRKPEVDGGLSDSTHQSADTGVRRSKREHHKPSFYDPVAYDKRHSSSDDDDEEEEDEDEEEEEEEAEEDEGTSSHGSENKLYFRPR